MENTLWHSVAAHLETIQTIDWNQAISSDVDIFSLLSIIKDGMPDQKCQLPPQLRDYHQFREHLYSVDGVIAYNVIPSSL